MGGGGEEEEGEKEVEEGEKEVETVAAKNHLGPEKSVTVGASCVSPSCYSSLPLLSPPPTCPPPQIRLSPLSAVRLLAAGGAGCGGVNGSACMREETLLISRKSATRLKWC